MTADRPIDHGRKWRQRSQWLNGILETIGDAVITIDADHRIIFFNEEASRIFGYAADMVIGENLDLLLPEADRAGHRGHVGSFARGQQAKRVMGERAEIRGRRRDGSEFWAEATISRMKTRDGMLFTAVLRDVSQRREMEQELRDAFQAIAEATAAKSRFFHSMSHELRTPLNAILGLSEMMAQELLGAHAEPRYREYCHDIHRSGSHLLDLVEEVMDYATAEYDYVPLQEAAVDLDALFEHCLNLKARLLAMARIRVSFRGDAGRLIWADPGRLQHLVVNLLLHARRQTPVHGEIIIHVGDTADGGLMVAVTDSGPGMSPEQMAAAFEPPRRGFPDYAWTGDSGLGLGLPIARRLVDLLGASLELSCAPGRGTRVSVIFPRERVCAGLHHQAPVRRLPLAED